MQVPPPRTNMVIFMSSTKTKSENVWLKATLEQRIELLFTAWHEHAILVDARLDRLEKKLKELTESGENKDEHTDNSGDTYMHT